MHKTFQNFGVALFYFILLYPGELEVLFGNFSMCLQI